MPVYSVFLAKNKKDKFLRYADKFYSTYRSELVAFEQKVQYDVRSMLDLLRKLTRAKKKNVLIVSHGWTDGLWLPLSSKIEDTATTDRLVMIRLMAGVHKTVQQLVADKAPDKWFVDRQVRSRTLKKLAEVFPWHDFAFQDEKEAYKALKGRSSKRPGKQYAEIENKVNVASRNEAALKSLGPVIQNAVSAWWQSLLTSSGLKDEKAARTYFDAIRDVRGVKIESVEIRGCMIGASAASSQVLRRILGAKSLRAPTVVIETGNPTAGVEVRETKKPAEHRWNIDGGYVKWSPGGVYRVSSKKVWDKWVRQRIGKPRGQVSLNMPLMYFGGSVNAPPQYPLDAGFEKLLATFTSA